MKEKKNEWWLSLFMNNKTSYYSITVLNAINSYSVKDEKESKWNLYFVFQNICSLFFFFCISSINDFCDFRAVFTRKKGRYCSRLFNNISQGKKKWKFNVNMVDNEFTNYREWPRFNIASSNPIDLARSCKLTSDKYYKSYFANKQRKHRWGSRVCVCMCARL